MNNYMNFYDYMNKLNSSQTSSFNYDSKFDYTTEPNIAFLRGNLFNNLYTPYKNYNFYNIDPSNEKEYDLLLVQMYDFAAHELNLYLDVNPNDSNAIKLRNEYVNMYKKAIRNYEHKYGPLGVDSKKLDNSPWMWVSKKWPWEGYN